jgi:RNA polymerase sigma-70 factor (family 1)
LWSNKPTETLPHSSFTEEHELLERIAGGDETAYTLVFNQYSQQVFDVAMLYLKDSIVAKEVVQDVFLKVWLKRKELPAIDNLASYLFILARNLIYDSFKKQAVRHKALDYLLLHQPGTVNDADHRLQDHQYAHLLEQAVSALPAERKKVYIARKQGLSNEEISHQLNISIHTVKKQMQLAMQALRSFVKNQLLFFW